jgi:hypothetical protein
MDLRYHFSRIGKPKKLSSLPPSRFGTAVEEAAHKLDFPNGPPSRLRYDFAFGRSDMSIFPFETWRCLSMRHALKISIHEVDYGPAAGVPALGGAICLHRQRSRAVVCESSEVIVVCGARQASIWSPEYLSTAANLQQSKTLSTRGPKRSFAPLALASCRSRSIGRVWIPRNA